MLTVKGWGIVFFWAIAALLIAVLQLIGVSQEIRNYYSNAIQLIAVLACGFFCAKTAFIFPPGNPMIKIWSFFAAGMFSWGIAEIFYVMHILLHNGAEPPVPHYSDFFFIGMNIFSIIALILFRKNVGLTVPVWGIVLSVLSFISSLYFGFVMESFSGNGLEFLVSTCYAVLDALLFATALAVASCLFGGRVAKSWSIMMAGFFVYFIANQLNTYLEYKELYYSGLSMDMLWVISFMLIAIAAMSVFNEFVEQ